MSAEDRECLFSPCNDQGALQTCKTMAVQKIVATSKAKRDELYKYIINGKAWTNALRAYRLIIAVLLRNFYSNGAKTYQELSVYLEAAGEHPTGKLWVDCLIKPALIALMFLRGMVTSSSSSASVFLCGRSPQLCPLPELVCASDGEPSSACQR